LGAERLRLLKVRNTRDEIDPTLDVEASFNLSYDRFLPEQQVFVATSVLCRVDLGVALAAVLGDLEEAEVNFSRTYTNDPYRRSLKNRSRIRHFTVASSLNIIGNCFLEIQSLARKGL
jgi:hypothetical protein